MATEAIKGSGLWLCAGDLAAQPARRIAKTPNVARGGRGFIGSETPEAAKCCCGRTSRVEAV